MPLLERAIERQEGTPPETPSQELSRTQTQEVEKKESYFKRSNALKKQDRQTITDYLKSLEHDLPPEITAILARWENPNKVRHYSKDKLPFLQRLYGPAPAVGDVITLQDVFYKTLTGEDYMKKMMKMWKDKNMVTVEYIHNQSEPILSQFIIRSIP